MRKIFAVFTIIGLLFAAVPTFAADSGKTFADVDEQAPYSAEVNALADNGILAGDENGDFRPEDEITRAEFAAVLCRAMGESIEKQALQEENINKSWYADVPPEHWAAGYINVATAYGAINGIGDGLFAPESPVTNEQVIKMLIAAWGYGDEAIEAGGYPNGYMAVAQKYGVLDAVAFNYGNASKRWVVSVFVYGVLEKLPVADNAEKKPEPPQIVFTDTSSTEREPIPENSSYIKDPVSILKKVTRDSVRFERQVFEQITPLDQFPFEIRDDAIYGITENAADYRVLIAIPDNQKETYVNSYIGKDGISLKDIPDGEYQTQFAAKYGAVSDVYFANIIKDKNETKFKGSNPMRYTSLAVRTENKEDRYTIKLSKGKTDEHFPFELSAATDGDGKYILYVDYPIPLENGQDLTLNLFTDKDDIFLPEPIFGYIQEVKPFVVENLKPNYEYGFNIRLGEKNGEDIAFRGTITLFEDGDFSLTGEVRVLTILGYEIDES